MYLRNDGTYGQDSYDQIKIRITEDPMGGIELCPISPRRQREVARSNLYDGTYTAYYQAWLVDEFAERFPRAMFRDYNGDLAVNDGCVILVDSWAYRHTVGGQTD